MPYIPQKRRCEIIIQMSLSPSAGDLNYALTTIALNYVQSLGKTYQNYNDVIGALECCKLEMYRRAVAPYEDSKIKENGDVY